MSNLIATDAQQQEPGSELVELFEVEISSSTTLYFHPGRDDDLSTIQFRDKDEPTTIRTYTALPVMIEGIELSGEGPQNRPTITIANVASAFRDALGGAKNEDLIGNKVVRRLTLKKYLYGESGDSNPPVEFPVRSYIIDRVSSENSLAVEFELASPFDVSGIKIPNRNVVGKYCSWVYQGYERSTSTGGCLWKQNSTISYADSSGTVRSHKAYFTIDDEPIVPASAISGAYSGATTYSKNAYVSHNGGYWRSIQDSNTGNTPSTSSAYWDVVRIFTVWSTGQTYSFDSTDPEASDYVEYGDTVWRCTVTHTSQSGLEPQVGSNYWKRGDVCGKALSSCKCRFQFVPKDPTTANSPPSVEKDTKRVLPFGAFPGSSKFK